MTVKIKKDTLKEFLRKSLFEMDHVQYGMFDRPAPHDEKESKVDTTVPDDTPIQPAEMMASQLVDERPPVEDDDYAPENTEEFSRAVKALAMQVGSDNVKGVYKDFKRMVLDPREDKKEEDMDKETNESLRRAIRLVLKEASWDDDDDFRYKKDDGPDYSAMDSEPVMEIEDAETRPGNEERPSESTQTTSLPVVEDTRPVAEEVELAIEEKKTVVAPVSTSVVEGDLTSYERLLRLIGLTEEADILAGSGDVSVVRRALASHVGREPRDVRVDRLLRLMLRLLPQGDQGDGERSEMIDSIVEILPKYNQWVRMRLEARHMGASGTFFEDANRLGTALQRVPGPGVRVPLHADTYPLPEPSNLNELHQQTERLIQSMHRPAAGGIN